MIDRLWPGGARGMLAILTYHRVLPQPDPLLPEEVHEQAFEAHMRMLAKDFNVLSVAEASGRLARGTLPPRAVSVTFDDGYANNEDIALPVLERIGIPATFFVATGFIDGGLMFNDAVIEAVRRLPAGRHDLTEFGAGAVDIDTPQSRRRAIDALIARLKYLPPPERSFRVAVMCARFGCDLPERLMMTRGQIARLARRGFEIGAHTVTHPILNAISDDEACREILAGKRTLEEITGRPVTSFAYPNGKAGRDYAPRHVCMVSAAGYAAAVSTMHGVCRAGGHRLQLPRMAPWERDPWRLRARLFYTCVRESALGRTGRGRAPEGMLKADHEEGAP